jgi:SAM-dependent methyltransferase
MMTLLPVLKRRIMPLVRSRGTAAFILQLPQQASMLDVGCGNASPLTAKRLRPDIHYVGVDVRDYRQTDQSKSAADEYLITEPERFADTIANLGQDRYDAVLSSHNIEHTTAPFDVLAAMCRVLKRGGQIYLAFPSDKSPKLPSRGGTLNFYDDPTHIWLPEFDRIVSTLERHDIKIVYQTRRYRPLVCLLIGVASEPYSRAKRQVSPFYGTWALYGFESVIWGRKS